MPCSLEKDPKHQFDALANAGDTATVFVKSDASPQVQTTAATFNGAAVQVDNDGKIQLPPFKNNTNVLNLTVDGIEAGDDIQFVEDCEDAETLSTKIVGSAPGGANPVVGFRISAS